MSEQREIPFGRPWITDEDKQAVMRVLGGHILTHGPECKSFEAEFGAFMGAPSADRGNTHCISVSSCMAALHLCYLHLGLGPGDEVICPAQTHVATVHAIEWVGAKPVFVDCDPATGNVTAELIAPAITAKTKAIGLVHFLGIPCEMDPIIALAEKHSLKIVEDCAIAIGARYKGVHVGLLGDMGCYSFYPVKHITTGEGGMFVTRHKSVADSVSKLRAFGVDRTHTERSIPGMYDVPTLGLNYRMSEMQAALGRTQMARFNENLARRKANFDRLKAALSSFEFIRVLDSTSADCQNSHYCLSMVLEGPLSKHRNDIVLKLNARGVGTSVYYPQPVPRMAYYRNKYGYNESLYPVTTHISDHSIALPVGVHISAEDIDIIASQLKAVVQEVVSQ